MNKQNQSNSEIERLKSEIAYRQSIIRQKAKKIEQGLKSKRVKTK